MNGYLSKFTFNLCLTAAIVSPAYGSEAEQSQRHPSEIPVEEALPTEAQAGENPNGSEGVDVQDTNLKVEEETNEKVESASQEPIKVVDPFLEPLNSFFQSKVVRLPYKTWKDALENVFMKNKTWAGLDDPNANCSLISNMAGKFKKGREGTSYNYQFGTDEIKSSLEKFLKTKTFKVDGVEIGNNEKDYKTHESGKSNALGEINVNDLSYKITIQDLMEMNAVQLIWNSNYYEFEKQSGSSEKSVKYLLKTHFGNMNVQIEAKTNKD